MNEPPTNSRTAQQLASNIQRPELQAGIASRALLTRPKSATTDRTGQSYEINIGAALTTVGLLRLNELERKMIRNLSRGKPAKCRADIMQCGA